jgi:glucose 1-dehydrogenase
MSKGKVLEHQVALVTGAGSGIGAEIARAFGSAGATVVVNYRRSSEDAEAVAGEIIAAGGKALALQGDVADEQQVRRLFARVIEKYGTLDILVNNAGIQKDSSFLQMSLESWNLVIGVNLTGQFLCAREAARKIICISSVHEVIPWAGHCNYAASKGGLNLLMRSVAQELAPYKIRVNSIAPGAIRTSINRDSWDTPQAEKELLRLIPYKRVGDPPDVANAAVWLASDDSDYVNGATLFVDGGMTLYPCFTGGG